MDTRPNKHYLGSTRRPRENLVVVVTVVVSGGRPIAWDVGVGGGDSNVEVSE